MQFRCGFCSDDKSTRDEFERHLLSVHGKFEFEEFPPSNDSDIEVTEELRNSSYPESVLESSDLVDCELCSARFNTTSQLKIHHQDTHTLHPDKQSQQVRTIVIQCQPSKVPMI